LAEIKRFDKPRVVTSSGNGALAVRGPCAEDGEPTPPARPDPVKLETRANGTNDKDRSKEKAKDDTTVERDKVEAKEPEAKASARPEAKSAGKPEANASPKPETNEPPRAPVNEVHPYCIFGHDDTWREVHVRGDIGGERVVVLADGRVV